MYCECCGEVLSKETEMIAELAQLPGAVFLACDTEHDGEPWDWPACFGIKKHRGCIEWGRGDKDESFESDGEWSIWLTKLECKRVYGDTINREEAWLVVPKKDYFDWYNVTDLIPFEGDEDQKLTLRNGDRMAKLRDDPCPRWAGGFLKNKKGQNYEYRSAIEEWKYTGI